MSTVDLLRASAPVAPEPLRRRVLELRPEPRRRVRVRPLLMLAAAAVAAVGAALVHGFAESPPAAEHAVTRQAFAPAASGAGSAHGVFAGTVAPTPNRLQHEDASLTLRVGDVGDATSRATTIVTSLGGYAQSVRYETKVSYIELRVPVQRVKQAIAQLGGLGTIASQTISIEDLTSTLQRQSAQIAELRRRVAALEQALRNPALPDAQRVLLQIKLAEAKRALAQRVSGRRGTVAAGATARISLVLTSKKHPAAAPHRRSRLSRILGDAVSFLAVEGIVLLFALIVASPLAIAGGLLWYLRRRATERLLLE
jgi:hypothetical protein